MKLLKCSVCGNIVEMIEDKGVPVMCCGKPMTISESSNPKQKRHALMGVNIYESQELYQRLQKPTTQVVP